VTAHGVKSPVWQLVKQRAGLRLAELRAAIDVSRPADGLADLRLGGDSLRGARVLGIEFPSVREGETAGLAECYVRGADLAAVYRESESWPVRVDAVWRADVPSASDGPVATLKLLVSVRAHVLDSRPELWVESVVPASEVLRLADAEPARFETVRDTSPLNIDRGEGAGCLVFRLPESDVSYAEMVHPADFLESRLEREGTLDRAVRVRHRLFSCPLEKGIVLRARVCGVLLARGQDTQLAAEFHAAFAAEEPPLGT
jgi:hypothetical protein